MVVSRRRIPDFQIVFAYDGSDAARAVISGFESRHHVYSRDGFCCVISCERGDEAMRVCTEEYPLIVVINDELPDMSGCELAKRISKKTQFPFSFVFLVDQGAFEYSDFDRDYYLTKPLELEDLEQCVQTIRRYGGGYSHVAHPVTRLPGGRMIEQKLNDIIHEQTWSLIRIAVNTRDVVDELGFIVEQQVIRFTADIIDESIEACGFSEDFVGHIGGCDFVVITHPERACDVMDILSSRFSKECPVRDQGSLLKLSMVKIEGKDGPFKNIRELTEELRIRK
jgi:CheY-like chemotaxis protein